MNRDLHNNVQFIQTLEADQLSTTTNCDGVDGQGFDSVEHYLHIGDAANTLGASPEVSWDVIIQHSDDDGSGSPASWAAVTDANDVLVAANGNVAAPDSSGVIATLDNDGDEDKLLRIGYRGAKRHSRLRLVANNSPGATDFAAGAVCVPLLRPATDATADINQ